MPRGGSKPGERRGGRKKGTPNRASIERQAKVAADGATPLDVHIYRMRYHLQRAKDEQGRESAAPELVAKELALADDAAKNAAPYVHPKLSTIAHTGPGGGPVEILVDLLQQIDGTTRGLPAKGQSGGHD